MCAGVTIAGVDQSGVGGGGGGRVVDPGCGTELAHGVTILPTGCTTWCDHTAHRL